MTWFRNHVEIGGWGRVTLVVAAGLEATDAVFKFQDGSWPWGLWWASVGAFALFAAIFAAPMPKKDT